MKKKVDQYGDYGYKRFLYYAQSFQKFYLLLQQFDSEAKSNCKLFPNFLSDQTKFQLLKTLDILFEEHSSFISTCSTKEVTFFFHELILETNYPHLFSNREFIEEDEMREIFHLNGKKREEDVLAVSVAEWLSILIEENHKTLCINWLPYFPDILKLFFKASKYSIENDGLETSWTPRKACASCIDTLAMDFAHNLSPILLDLIRPIILNYEKEETQNEDWKLETAILFWGAVSEGFKKHSELLNPVLELSPYVIRFASENQSNFIQAICCWALSRYSREIEMNNRNSLKQALDAILSVCNSENSRVIESALSAISVFLENVSYESMEPSVSQIVSMLIFHLQNSKKPRSFELTLGDSISTFLETVPLSTLKNLSESHVLSNLLYERFASTEIPKLEYMETLSCLIKALKISSTSAEMVINKCILFLEDLEQNGGSEANAVFDLLADILNFCVPNNQVVVSLLEKFNIIDYILRALVQVDTGTIQSIYGFMGDYVKFAFEAFTKNLSVICTFLSPLLNLNFHSVGTLNNAIWCLGQIVVQAYNHKFSLDLTQTTLEVCGVLKNPASHLLKQNCVLTLSRLGFIHPQLVLVCLNDVAVPFFQNAISESNEKNEPEEYESQWQGILHLMHHNKELFMKVLDLIPNEDKEAVLKIIKMKTRNEPPLFVEKQV